MWVSKAPSRRLSIVFGSAMLTRVYSALGLWLGLDLKLDFQFVVDHAFARLELARERHSKVAELERQISREARGLAHARRDNAIKGEGNLHVFGDAAQRQVAVDHKVI